MIFRTPQRLYHGTTDNSVPSFRKKLLDSRFWRPGRDFGEGFYTTISAAQARKWAVKTAAGQIGNVRPCVLEIELISVPSSFEPLIFLSDSLEWAKFILMHRLATKKGADPCPKHPDLIIGPMADSDTGKIVDDYVKLNKDLQWFYDQITRSARGKRLDPLRLGNQVVFASEKWEQSLRLVGFYVHASKGRWIFYEQKSSAQSL
jgi:hypothetical protein